MRSMECRKTGVPLPVAIITSPARPNTRASQGAWKTGSSGLDDDRSEPVHPPEVVHPVHGHHCTTGDDGQVSWSGDLVR